uniref:AA_permease domain-containing protein n=1 Tax=Gongylonema pulchrum TaxID=637853 RepID=A0A183DH58_9BILA
LGVMLGVYLPTIQHILGVTMFIRLAWVVGIAGIRDTMLLLLLCCLCMEINLQTLLTSISLSAVATNGVVESGGAYFMISRNLGAEFGSAVGILFYLANTVAASMYLVGGVEVMLVSTFHALMLSMIAILLIRRKRAAFPRSKECYRIICVGRSLEKAKLKLPKNHPLQEKVNQKLLE